MINDLDADLSLTKTIEIHSAAIVLEMFFMKINIIHKFFRWISM